MTALPRQMNMEQGATFTTGWNWYRESDPLTIPPTQGLPYEPVSARMQIRAKIDTPPMLDLSSTGPDPRIILGPDGRFDIRLRPADTSLLTAGGVYDLFVTLPDGDVRRLLFGKIKLSKGVTRE